MPSVIITLGVCAERLYADCCNAAWCYAGSLVGWVLTGVQYWQTLQLIAEKRNVFYNNELGSIFLNKKKTFCLIFVYFNSRQGRHYIWSKNIVKIQNYCHCKTLL
jgi:hypothetical protein